jgi:hypothetical protein
MEHMIALQDSKNGKMDRRPLIQRLTFAATTAFCARVTATAASVAIATPRAAAAGKDFKAVAYNHISYNVADVARIRDFYVDLYGMKVAWDDGKQCPLECGNRLGVSESSGWTRMCDTDQSWKSQQLHKSPVLRDRNCALRGASAKQIAILGTAPQCFSLCGNSGTIF